MASTTHPLRVEERPAPPGRLRADARRWVPWAAVLVLAAAAGLVSGQLAPLGPVSTLGALVLMATGAALGLVGGGAVGTAWVVVPMAAAYLGAVEIARTDVLLPTVHDVRIDSIWGLLALVLGRGVYAALLVLPMIVGAQVGAGAGGRVSTRVLGVLTLALAVAVALPASTPPVRDADGGVVPGSIATLDRVLLGGDPHTVLVRAADPDAPVLLYLSGGPGQSDLALARALSEPWVDDVVFVAFDQRGNGTSYAALVPTEEATLDRAVTDVIELTAYLRARFGEDKVILLGESWGTILGVLAVERRPDLFHAYLGSGQMVDVTETDRRIYRDLVAHADRTDDAAVAELTERIGEPPYADLPWANADVMLAYEHLYGPYAPSQAYLDRGAASGLDAFGIRGPEYRLVDKVDVLRGLIDTFSVMYPQIQGLDLRREVPRLEVPVFLLDGAAELDGRRDLALEWFAALDAPTKKVVTFEGAAHAVAFEQADAVDRLLADEVLPLVGER